MHPRMAGGGGWQIVCPKASHTHALLRDTVMHAVLREDDVRCEMCVCFLFASCVYTRFLPASHPHCTVCTTTQCVSVYVCVESRTRTHFELFRDSVWLLELKCRGRREMFVCFPHIVLHRNPPVISWWATTVLGHYQYCKARYFTLQFFPVFFLLHFFFAAVVVSVSLRISVPCTERAYKASGGLQTGNLSGWGSLEPRATSQPASQPRARCKTVCVCMRSAFSYAAVRLLYTTMFVCFTVAVLFLQQQPPLCPGMLHVCGVWARTIVCPGFPIGMRGGGAHSSMRRCLR